MSLPAPWMTTQEAADYARVSSEHITRACRSKALRSVKVGRYYRVRPEWVDAWLIGKAAA